MQQNHRATPKKIETRTRHVCKMTTRQRNTIQRRKGCQQIWLAKGGACSPTPRHLPNKNTANMHGVKKTWPSTRPLKRVSPKVKKKTCFSDVVSFHIINSLSFVLHTNQCWISHGRKPSGSKRQVTSLETPKSAKKKRLARQRTTGALRQRGADSLTSRQSGRGELGW